MEATTAGEARPQWAELAYEAIAPVYDDFTAHHDYELWLGNLLPELERPRPARGPSARRRLRDRQELPPDAGARLGGDRLRHLGRRWWSWPAAKVGEAAALSVADMRELPAFGEFDLVWALDDAVNYLLSAEELEQALSGMRANLAPGGLLMFDVNTLQAYRTFFAEDPGGRGRWAAADLARPRQRRDAAGLDRRSELRGRAPRRRTAARARSAPSCTASATSPKPRSWP